VDPRIDPDVGGDDKDRSRRGEVFVLLARCHAARPQDNLTSMALGPQFPRPPREVRVGDHIRAAQLQILGAGIARVLPRNPFYRGRLHRVETWDDFARLPLTTKDEITADQQANPPFGTNLTFPIDRYTRLQQTSGTSGTTPLRWLDTPESWEWWARIWADHIYRSAGVTRDDRVFFAFSFGPFVGFWSAFSGAERLGALVIPGGAMTTEQRLRNMLDLRLSLIHI